MTENHPLENQLVTRVEILGIAGIAALPGLTGSVAGALPQTPQTRPRMACCVSFWGGSGSNADWSICKLMVGCWWQFKELTTPRNRWRDGKL